MSTFKRPEHVVIHDALRMMKSEFLLANECWFGGGTAIVLANGEYRQSLDVDFLCSSQDGYRELRSAVLKFGPDALFSGPITTIREFRCDQYGIRAVLSLQDQPIKFEIVREGRIALTGTLDDALGCPILSLIDQFAEKLLANSDRCHDASVCYRDAFDLGMLVLGNNGTIPEDAIDKSVGAYGNDIWTKLRWVVSHLGMQPVALSKAATTMQMRPEVARAAIRALSDGARRLDPDSSFDWEEALQPATQDAGDDDDIEHDQSGSRLRF